MVVIPQSLYSLAPTALPVHRSRRFDGAGYEVPLDSFGPADRDIIARLYGAVQGLATLWHSMRESPDYGALKAYIRRVGGGGLMGEAARLGQDSPPEPALRKAAHDIRGGGLTVMIGTAELLGLVPGDDSLTRKCVDAARDHAKIMRNLLPDIDPAVRAADEAAKAHDVAHFTSKWEGMVTRGPSGAVSVGVHCEFAGAISARCLETSSIDRVVYNLVNNAVRFAAGGAVTLWIFPVAEGLTRWVVQNEVAADQADFLTRAVGGDLGRLFAGGVTRGGTGVGMANCAEIVSDCFGLGNPAKAVDRKYVGAAVRGTEFDAWFHWPAFVPGEQRPGTP